MEPTSGAERCGLCRRCCACSLSLDVAAPEKKSVSIGAINPQSVERNPSCPVAECVLNLGLASIACAREVVISHCNGNITSHIDLVVFENHVRPALAAVDGEPASSE